SSVAPRGDGRSRRTGRGRRDAPFVPLNDAEGEEDRRKDARRDRGPDEAEPRPEYPDDQGQERDDDEDPTCGDHDLLSLLYPLFPTSRGILPRRGGPAKTLGGV